jgi:hypothetical protein
VVVPKSDKPRPFPNAATLKLVGDYLNQHRLITTELHIAPPRYRKVEIHVTAVANPAVASNSLMLTLRQKLLDYFHPIKGGPEGAGWTFGNKIAFSETYGVILSTPGIVRIEGDVMTIVDGEIQPRCTDVQLEVDELVYSEEHLVQVIYA